MEIKKILHKGFEEFDNARLHGVRIPQYFGKWQYLFRYKGFEISLVKLKDCMTEKWFWEIYCLKGDLFKNVERFRTKKDAEIRIKEIVGWLD